MIGIAVVALAIVFHRELPVAGLDQFALIGDLGVAHPMRRDVGRHALGHFIEILGRIFGKTDEQQAFEGFQVHRL